MPRSIWNGAIAFGAVNVPVKVFGALEDKAIHFHEVHLEDGGGIEHRLVNPGNGREVKREKVVKGYEVSSGKWVVLFFYPLDFTFVCPTEIAAFGKLNDEFEDRDTQILGVSIDSEFVHFQWRAQHEDLKKLPFPMLSDIKRELSLATGVLNADGVADRVTFIVDPNNEIQFVSATAGSVGRNVDEVLRVLDALQSDELCACNWRKGDPTIDAGELLKASA